MSSSEDGSRRSFEALMRLLQEQHDLEVRALRSELERHQGSAVMPSGGVLAALAAEPADITPPTPEPSAKAPEPQTAAIAETPPAPVEASEGEEARGEFGGPLREPSEGEAARKEAGGPLREPSERLEAREEAGGPLREPPSTSPHHKGSFIQTRRGSSSADGQDERSALRAWFEDRSDIYMGAVICLNVVFVYAELERTGAQAGADLGATSGGRWPDVEVAFSVIANIFAVTFLLELFLKVYFERGSLVCQGGQLQKLNIFDALIVLASVCDMWIVSPVVGNPTSGSSLQVVRLLRFVRVLRTMRIIHTFEIFSKLRVLVATVAASFFALFWSLVLLSIVMLMAALFMCQSVNLIFLDDTIDVDFKVEYFRYFGTPSKSLWTIFEITFGGGWQKHARPLVEEVSPLWAVFFVVYIAGVLFVMFKIITALFLKDTMAVAAQDVESTIHDKIKEKARYAQKLVALFAAADSSSDGCVTWAEFEELLDDETARAYLASLEIDATSGKFLFELLDNGDGSVSVQEFVDGALRLKGQARASDVVSLMHDTSKVLQKLASVEAALAGIKSTHTFV